MNKYEKDLKSISDQIGFTDKRLESLTELVQTIKNEEGYADFLYWELVRKGHINNHAFMLLFYEKFNRYPIFDEVRTFKQSFHYWWYRNVDKYF